MRMNRNARRANLRRNNVNSSRRNLNCGESYGWEVDASDAQDAYLFACDYFGKENLDDQIVNCLSTDDLSDCLAFIFRMNEFREWEAYKNGEDLDDLDSSRKRISNGRTYTEALVKCVSMPVILRDWDAMDDANYLSAKCRKLVDIADTLYNMGNEPEIVERLKGEYKDLYEEFGKEFWDEVLDDVYAIDTQMSSEKVDDLYEDYIDWTFKAS